MRLFLIAAALFMPSVAFADGIEIHDAYTLPTTATAMSGVGYMMIHNHGDTADRLLDVRSDAAARVMVHVTTQTDTGVMQMRTPDGGIDLPAGGALMLAPEGTHIMFMGLTAPFAIGDTIPVTLIFDNAGAVAIDLPVVAQ